jgi:photosystem II stability/assembly factor-like uncharacterized protein
MGDLSLPGCRTSVLALLLMLSIAGSSFAAVEYAPILPLASKSLLLGIASAGDRIVTAGERGHILYSDDNGGSWVQAKVPTRQMLTAVHFIDERRGWSVGHDGLVLVSDDGGANWRIQRDGIAAQAQANLSARERAHQKIRSLEAAAATAEGEQATELALQLEDANMDLEDADLALQEAVFTSPLMDVWFQDKEHGWAVGAFGTLLATEDGGSTWRDDSKRLQNPDEFHLNAVTGDGAGRVFIAGEGGAMYRSRDSGLTWEALPIFYQGSWFGLVYTPDPEVLLVFGLRGNLYRSTDFGDSWDVITNDSQATIAGGSADARGRIALVGAAGTLLQSRDGGLSFDLSTLGDRLNLSSAIYHGERLIFVGQGGIKARESE